MSNYRCQVCGAVYEPAKGDPTQDVPPGTEFGDLPDNWLCPTCGSARDLYEKQRG